MSVEKDAQVESEPVRLVCALQEWNFEVSNHEGPICMM